MFMKGVSDIYESISCNYINFTYSMCYCHPFFIRSFLWQSILKKIYNGQYDKAIQQMNAPLYTFLFSTYEKNYNILRAYISKQDTNKITKQVEFMLSQNLNNSQAYQVASMTYFYFLDSQNVELSKKLLEIIERKGNEDEITYDRMLYRILIEKKSEDISFVNELLSKHPDNQQQGILQYLLGLQYQYLSDVKQANYYLNKAKKNLKGTPYHKKVKESMV